MQNNTKLKTYILKTYGCQMNFSDSERIDTVMQKAGFKPMKNIDKADVIIFNTCSVRQSAEDRILGLGKMIKQLKKRRNVQCPITNYQLLDTIYQIPVTILTGCMTKRSWDKSINEIASREKKYLTQLKQRMPWVDIIIQIKDISELPKLLGLKPSNHLPALLRFACKALQAGSTIQLSQNKPDYLMILPTNKSKVTAYIPISTGCNEFCTYCIVPYARGKQIDRPAEDIIADVKTSIKKSFKDIVLLGQNINSWKNPENKSPKDFLALLKATDNIPGYFWLTFLSSHPNYFTDELIEYFSKSANLGTQAIEKGSKLGKTNHIRPYLNLALQSGSNEILKRMNRKYTVEKFIKICKELKKRIPNLNLSTDIIVGFPGETEKDFEETIEVMKELEFDMAYINKYSPRKGTAADIWEDDVPWKIKKKREKILNTILAKTALKNNKKYINRNVIVLVEKIKKEKSKYFAYGKTFNYKDIKISLKKNPKIKIGEFIPVIITKATSWHLVGKLISPQ